MIRRANLLFILTAFLAGCQSGGFAPSRPDAQQAGSGAPAPAASAAPSRILAYINGEPVREKDLSVALLEAAGGEVLRETLLQQAIDRRLSKAGLQISQADADAEHQILLASLAQDENEAQRLLDLVKERRRLGDSRYQALLRRNAGLRKLVADQAVVSEADLARAFELQYGPRYQARLIVTGSRRTAAELRDRAIAGESFSDLAVEHSTDSSAAQGGLLSPISPADPSWPRVLRQALPNLEPGQVSEIISLEGSFAIAHLERKIAPQPIQFEAVRPQLERQVRLQAQQRLMQQLAASMVSDANVVVLDPTLGESWKRQRDMLLPAE